MQVEGAASAAETLTTYVRLTLTPRNSRKPNQLGGAGEGTLESSEIERREEGGAL